MARLTPLAALLIALGPPAQDPAAGSPVVARYRLAGEPAIVSRDDLALELCLRFRGAEQGRDALEFVVDCELIETAARAARLMPDAAATRLWTEKLEQRLQAAGFSLQQLRAEKNMSSAEFAAFAALQLAHERLVRASLELDDDEPVKPQMLELWLREARVKHAVVTDPALLPPGAVARVGERQLTELDLGRALVHTSATAQRHKYIRQIVVRRAIAAAAERHGIEVTSRDVDGEVAARRREVERDPKYQGVPFEQILQAQGTSLEAMRESPVLLAQIQERKLSERLLPEAEMRRRIAEDRDAVMLRHGARRRLSVLLVRRQGEAADAEARRTAEQVRERIVREMPFAEAARTYSDDPYTKVAGGDAGWHNRTGSRLPAAVVEAAFAADIGAVSEPLTTDEGYWLVQPVAAEPEPTDVMVMLRMRQELLETERQRILEEAHIEFADDS